jgi:hypothetical protein
LSADAEIIESKPRQADSGDRRRSAGIDDFFSVHRLSDNVGGVKQLLSIPIRALGEERHFALVEMALPTTGSLVIVFQVQTLLRLVGMCQPFLLDLSGRGVEQSDLLKLGMEIYSYNDHCSAPFSRASWLVLPPPTLTRVREPTLSWNQFHSSSRKKAKEKRTIVITPVSDS